MSKSFLTIDELSLDKEWIRQPGLYFKYSLRLADARTAWDNAKAMLDVVSAELETKVRRKPSKFGIESERITEAMVSGAVARHNDYRMAHSQTIDAQHKVRVLEATVSALEHRRSALTRLVELKQMDYFSEPSMRNSESRTRHQETIKQEAVRRTMKKER